MVQVSIPALTAEQWDELARALDPSAIERWRRYVHDKMVRAIEGEAARQFPDVVRRRSDRPPLAPHCE